ncbi:hypothetical protein DLAC_11788 [Tieghemostelium lacteum]|uniref:Nicotinamide-nucleotide adenylyltransferase n=1 Tax=Tieghemostelium lacteum TaxID=361077 RepID=A0A151Z752_TIELA|nr:hypothetical protein DLAC_11788 [Tieghemostelium lacteum]|eukprot:KYQ89789.1 hypothetical protein DLAC_11788 [Tieghemostelium lacteum]
METYRFPVDKLKEPTKDTTKQPVVLLACGSFNPITYMHLRMMEIARDYLIHPNKNNKYEVIGGYLSPVGDAYKKKTLININYRKEMTSLALKDSNWLMMDLWESSSKDFIPTRQVLDHIRKEISNHFNRDDIKVKLVCGADLLGSFNIPDLWDPNDMKLITSNDHYGMLCLERSGSNLDEIISKNQILTDNRKDIHFIPISILNDISSTKLREKVFNGESIKYLTNNDVIDYINQNNLYKTIPQ